MLVADDQAGEWTEAVEFYSTLRERLRSVYVDIANGGAEKVSDGW